LFLHSDIFIDLIYVSIDGFALESGAGTVLEISYQFAYRDCLLAAGRTDTVLEIIIDKKDLDLG
jgi:hypothetical protein